VRRRRLLAALALACIGFAAQAADGYSLRGRFEQGAVVFGHTDPHAQVTLNGHKLLLTSNGDFVFGFDRDANGEAELSLTLPGRPPLLRRYAIEQRQWPTQRIQGLPPELVTPPPEVQQRIAAEAERIAAAHVRDTAIDDFTRKFTWPAHGRVSGVFGSQRILNGIPKQPHYGVDLAVPTGTPVHAPAGGIIALAEPALYFTGGTVIIDHGHGLSSVLVHLSKPLVHPGDRVERGQVVALSGMTGRATGPHLHWGVFWFDTHVDAQQLVSAER
jgi:murein DD-endopeptidase MepM/ murein hydrolase activator NlpD